MTTGQKGIMLCERPGPTQMATGPEPKPFLPSSVPSSLEPLGLVPTLKSYPPSLAPPPENTQKKSVSAVRQLEEENRLAALIEEERRRAETVKADNVTAFGAQLRAAILSGDDVTFWKPAKQAEAIKQSLEMRKARTAAAATTDRSPAAATDALTSSPLSFAADAPNKDEMRSFVDEILQEAVGAMEAAPVLVPAASSAAASTRTDDTANASTSAAASAAAPAAAVGAPRGGRRGKAGAAANKPAWALTEEQVAKLEDAEEEDLLRFADSLDFDSFMSALDDVELQENLKASSGEDCKRPAPGEEKAWRRSLVRAMNHAALKHVASGGSRRGTADEAGSEDGSFVAGSEAAVSVLSRQTASSRLKSEAGVSKRVAIMEAGSIAGGSGGGWDASSRAADDVGRMDRVKAASAEAAEFLRENPELRSVHSPASVRTLLGKTEGTATAAAVAGGL